MQRAKQDESVILLDVILKGNASESDPCLLEGPIGVAEVRLLRRKRSRARRWDGVCMVRLVRRCIVLVRGWECAESGGRFGGWTTWRDMSGEDVLVVEGT